MMTAANIRYGISDRTRAIAAGGIGAIRLVARELGLVEDVNTLHVLKRHQPYFESDHILPFPLAYDLPAGGSRIEHLEC